MNREANIARFEAELAKVQRPGMGLLLEYIRHSDFYTAPASTHYHLSCEGGLLQHSLNVLDALRGLLMKEPDGKDEAGNPKVKYHYVVADKFVATFPQDSVISPAPRHLQDLLLHYQHKERQKREDRQVGEGALLHGRR